MVTSASAIFSYIWLASRLSGSSTEIRVLAAEECWLAAQPPNAPQASESRTSTTIRTRIVAGVVVARRAAGGAGGGRGGRRGSPGAAGQRGGHEPISPTCRSPSVTTAAGSGWNP